jgi:KUP system potassium uptake protein
VSFRFLDATTAPLPRRSPRHLRATSTSGSSIAKHVDNDAEGGILILMALLGVKRERGPVIFAVGLFGAALIYGVGAIAPAISVVSAL